MEKISWNGYEYTHHERSTDWFWTLGLIVVLSAGLAIYEGDILFGIFILISGALFAFFAIRKPLPVVYSLSDKGLLVNDTLIAKTTLKEFWIAEKDEGDHVLLLNLNQGSFPRLSIFVPQTVNLEALRTLLSTLATETSIRESASEKIFMMLGL
jgi:hypothetical protein